MTGHTPGPWEWTTNIVCPTELKGAFVFIKEGERHCTLAAVGARDVGHQGICEANARVMAAGPVLVEALEDAERLLLHDAAPPIDPPGDNRIYQLDGALLGNCLNKIRAALTKARRAGV